MSEENIKIKFNQTTFNCFNCKNNTDNSWFLLKDNVGISDDLQNIKKQKNSYHDCIQDFFIYREKHNQELYFSKFNKLYIENGIGFEIWASQCNICYNKTIWIKQNEKNEIIWPKSSIAPEPNEDMSQECKNIFNEARLIFEESPRAAAILLRVVLEKNIKHVFNINENKNMMMGDLLKNKDVQEALENIGLLKLIHSAKNLCNEAAHSSIMILNDETVDDCTELFDIINQFCDELISRKIKNNNFQKKYNKFK